MYEAIADPYCYLGTARLKNLPDLDTQAELDAFEAACTMQRADEPLPAGRLSVRHYLAVHHHLFQDVYGWAGKARTVRLARGASSFCYPEHIGREMKALFQELAAKRLRGLSPDAFAVEAAAFLATLNAIHPFRESNGRTQTLFLALVADRAGHPFDFDKLEPVSFLGAMVTSFRGDTGPLASQIRHLIA